MMNYQYNPYSSARAPNMYPMQNTQWHKNITHFTPSSAELNKKHYESYKDAFWLVDMQINQYQKTNIIVYFNDVSHLISREGELPLDVFQQKMAMINIQSNSDSYKQLVSGFKNLKTNMFQLIQFISIFSLFHKIPGFNNQEVVESEGYSSQKYQTQPIGSSNVNTNKDQNNTVNNNYKQQEQIPSTNSRLQRSENEQKGNNSAQKIVFKNRRKAFTQKDIDGYKEVFVDMNILINEEYNMSVSDYFRKKEKNKNGLITLATFKNFINSNYEIDFETDHSYDDMLIYLVEDELIEGEEVIKIDRLTEVIKYYTTGSKSEKDVNQSDTKPKQNDQPEKAKEENKQIPTQTQQKETKQIPPANKAETIIREFSQAINNNKCRFSLLFPSADIEYQNQTMSQKELENGFRKANYSLSTTELNTLMEYFDPKKKEKVDIQRFKEEIMKYSPTYFDQPFQTKPLSKTKPTFDVTSTSMYRTHLSANAIGSFNKIRNYFQNQNVNAETYFSKLKQENNSQITKQDFITCLNEIPDLNQDDKEEVFEIIDANKDNEVEYFEIVNAFDEKNMTNERFMNTKLTSNLVKQVSDIFDTLDNNKDDKISKEDFLKALKAVNGNSTMEDINKYLKDNNKEASANIDKTTFMDVMEKITSEKLIIQDEEKEYVVGLFRQIDVDKTGYLTPKQLKYVLKEKLKTKLSDEEIDKMISASNLHNDEFIDIDQFVQFLYEEVCKTEDDNLQRTVMNIKFNKQLNPRTFISVYNGLPKNFIPSFIREQHKLLKLLPSSMLIPKRDITGTLYEDIEPVQQQNNQTVNTSGKNYLAPKESRINAKIFLGTATGVSSPHEGLFTNPDNKLKIICRTLKIVLYNQNTKQFISNALSIDATYNKDYQDRWYFEDDSKKFNNNIIIRYNGTEIQNVVVVFEFVIVIQRDNVTTETSCGWTSIPIGELYKTQEIKKPIQGGSPMKPEDINPTDIRTKRQGWGKFSSIFSSEVKSLLPIKIKTFKDLNSNDKLLINYLPLNCLVHRAAMQMVCIYRKILGEHILNHQDYSVKKIKNEDYIINNFCKIADCPDAYRIMVELWNEVVIEGGTSTDRKNDEYLKEHFRVFVNRIYSVLFAETFQYDELDPTKVALGDISLMEARNNLINSVIRNDKDQKLNKLNYKPVETFSNFKPFSIDEIKGEKINLVNKLDEIKPNIN